MSSKTNKPDKNYKKSAFAELSALSAPLIALIFLIIAACIALYIGMNIRVDKTVYVRDDAEIFTNKEIKQIKKIASNLSDDEDINVIVYTTRDKGVGYDNSDEDCDKFVRELYIDKCIPTDLQRFRDNSGFFIYIDLTEDVPGRRYIQIYTYGTAHYEIGNDECNDILQSHRKALSNGDYGEAVIDILSGLEGRNINDSGKAFMYAISIILPAILAFLITWAMSKNKRLDKAPSTSQYKVSHYDEGDNDKFIRKSVVVTTSSSSSGGGGSFGGGGGGHSGGGSMRF